MLRWQGVDFMWGPHTISRYFQCADCWPPPPVAWQGVNAPSFLASQVPQPLLLVLSSQLGILTTSWQGVNAPSWPVTAPGKNSSSPASSPLTRSSTSHGKFSAFEGDPKSCDKCTFFAQLGLGNLHYSSSVRRCKIYFIY